MTEYWKRQFGKLKNPNLSHNLTIRILAEVENQVTHQRSLRKFFALTSLSSSIAFTIPLSLLLADVAHKTGLLEILSIAHSDTSFVITHLNQFSLAVLEALPSFEISALLATCFVAMFSARELYCRKSIQFNHA